MKTSTNSSLNNMRIIVIDDNPAIHTDFLKILSMNPSIQNDSYRKNIEDQLFGEHQQNAALPKFEIDTASQGKEGVEKIASALKSGKPYALAFVDIRMPPGWDGVETIKKIWAIDKQMQVVICTAYSDYSWEDTVNELGHNDNLLILKKPFDNIAVRQLAYALTKKWQLLQDAKAYTLSLENKVNERTQLLNESLALMRATLNSSAEGVVVVNENGIITNYNSKFLELFELSDLSLKSTTFEKLSARLPNKKSCNQQFRDDLLKIEKNVNATIIGELCQLNDKIFEYYTQPYMLGSKICGRVWSFRDVTERVSLEKVLEYQTKHDALTGLPNRVLLHEEIRAAIAVCEKHKSHFAILFLDLDRFKLVNDSLSHQAGDELLKSVANRLKTCISLDDTLARIGGDEFVILTRHVSNNNCISELANRIINIFKEPFIIEKHEIVLSTSIGASIFPTHGNMLDELLRNADIAMYKSKSQSGNQCQFYSEALDKKNIESLELESDLRQAINENQLRLYYQPQFDVSTDQLVSVEALIRWQHPKKALLLPIDFIPLAEESGLIVPIGEWVIRTACQQLAIWQKKKYPPIRVAVNITTKQLLLPNLIEVISKILKDTGVEAKYLEIELTENMIINNKDLIETIYRLKELGVQIALDDFGTGYSSLNYLRELPIDRLKIDKSYVQNIEANRGDDVIIKAIIAMATSMNLEVLAEGVETQKQLEFLKDHRCNKVQGYYFSKPLSTDDCEAIMRDQQTAQTESIEK